MGIGIYIKKENNFYKVKKEFRIKDGICKEINKEWIIINGEPKLIFQKNKYDIVPYIEYNSNIIYNDVFCGIENDTLRLYANVTGNASSNVNGSSLHIYIYGDFANQSLSFHYDVTNYNTLYSTIGYDIYDAEGNQLIHKEFKSDGQIDIIIPSGAVSIWFSIWFGGKTSTRTSELIIQNMKINNESIFI